MPTFVVTGTSSISWEQSPAFRREPKGIRVARHHLPNTNVPQIEPPAWVGQREAARELNIGLLRIGLLIANDHLEGAEDSERNMGVTRLSLDAELRWRRETRLVVRLLRPIRDTVNWF